MILDVDPGHDDAVALMLACGAPELEVRAVTTVAGNVSLPKTTRNALRVLSLIGRTDVPVGAGADAPLERPLHTAEDVHGESGLDGLNFEEPAFEADDRGAVRLIADVLKASAEPVTLVPTGPLTNVAMFLTEHPRLAEKIGRIVLMGGSIGPGNTTPAAEFNIYVDPEAARAVFGSGVPITMAGLDVTREAGAGPEEVERLRGLSRVGEVAAELVTFSAGAYERDYRSERAARPRRGGRGGCRGARDTQDLPDAGGDRVRGRADPRRDRLRPPRRLGQAAEHRGGIGVGQRGVLRDSV